MSLGCVFPSGPGQHSCVFVALCGAGCAHKDLAVVPLLGVAWQQERAGHLLCAAHCFLPIPAVRGCSQVLPHSCCVIMVQSESLKGSDYLGCSL